MCGIVGAYRRKDSDQLILGQLQMANQFLKHRGPDDSGQILIDSTKGTSWKVHRDQVTSHRFDLYFGSQRLAIMDQSKSGRQPMKNEGGDCFLLFNGEIYNHQELRLKLKQKGHFFQSRTDSEVVLHSYEEWGADCVCRFNGMWALAIWDQKNRRLFCSRDRFGIKPFYYFLSNQLFAFASEIKALLPLLKTRPQPNLELVHNYLCGIINENVVETFFQGILKLKPAHNLIVTSDSHQLIRYWEPSTENILNGRIDPYKEFRRLLRDSVKLRTQNSVEPVGLALSGGLDSTALLCCMADTKTCDHIHAFSSVFPGFRYDETVFAKTAAERFNAKLHRVVYEPEHLLEDLERIVWHLDYPTGEFQVLARWHLMQQASQKLKVILEGQGGDELLAGYSASYLGVYIAAEMKSPGGRSRVFRSLMNTIRGATLRSSIQVARALSPSLSKLAQRIYLTHIPLNREFKNCFPLEINQTVSEKFGDPLTDRLYFDLTEGMLPRLLRFGDAISMAHSLESRVPFLDHRLVQFILTLPFRFKMEKGISKPILRHAFKKEIPQSILNRKDKIGFDTPLGKWLKSQIVQIQDVLLDSRCINRKLIEREGLKRLIKEVQSGKKVSAPILFRVLSLELWYRQFIDPKNTSDSSPVPRSLPSSWA